MLAALILISSLVLISLIYLIYLQKGTKDGATIRQHEMFSEFSSRLSQEIQSVRKEISETTGRGREEVQNRLDNINKELLAFQKNTTNTLQNQFTGSQKIIAEISEKLAEIGGTNKQVLGFAQQMKSLENILKNPKQRGVLGEYFLEALLGNILAPGQYKMQYRFNSGEIVDAVVLFNQKVIPIDSKFSLEKYNLMIETSNAEQRDAYEKEFKADVKKRIDETAKYIRPNENTTDFAFMFVPAEGIYYNLLIYNVGTVPINTQDLVEYAFRRHVVIVSPTSFYAYLQTILQGLNAMRIEESVKEIVKRVGELRKHLQSFGEFHDKVGKNIQLTVSSYNNASREFRKVDKDILRITGNEGEESYQVVELEKPNIGE